MVIGKVADDEAVEKAVNIAGAIAGNILYGDTPPRKRKNAGSVSST
jgi:hypothetical protein